MSQKAYQEYKHIPQTPTVALLFDSELKFAKF